ncbi:MAG: hypothetical protein ACYCUI_07190 [Vulcanimicrobiaceae bacterium]
MSDNVTFLDQFKSAKNAPPSLLVERINERCRWNVAEGTLCGKGRFGRCWRVAQFVISTLGAKKAWVVCGFCLGDFCAQHLERPKAEAEKMEAERLERLQHDTAEKAAREKHVAAKLCTGYSAKAPFHLCQRMPVVKSPCTSGVHLPALDQRCAQCGQHRFCARHAIRPRKWGWPLVPFERPAGTDTP